MKKTSTKLKLNTSTIQVLRDRELGVIVGGESGLYTTRTEKCSGTCSCETMYSDGRSIEYCCC